MIRSDNIAIFPHKERNGIMPRLTRKHASYLLLGAIALVLALVIGQCSMGTSAAQTAAADPVTVTKLSLNKDGQPRVRVTTTKRIDLLFARPRSDSTADDLVRQKANTTKVYRLPRVRDGRAAAWYVVAYNPRNGHELHYQKYVWRNYKRQVVSLSVAPKAGPTDVYAEIHPKKGGKLRVRSVRVRLIGPAGNVRWADLVHAYTDEERGVRVYVKTVRRGIRITDVDARTVYGSLRNVAAIPVG